MAGMTLENNTRERVADLERSYEVLINADADGLSYFTAPEAGYCEKCILSAKVAADGTNGYEIFVINRSDSDNNLGYFGFGSATEAAKADDKDVAVAALETATITNATNRASTDRCNAGDLIEILIDRDGTGSRGLVTVVMKYDGIGR